VQPDLDDWLPNPGLRVVHRRESDAGAERLWDAARAVLLSDTAMLGRLVRWRIPGTSADQAFDRLLREPPFLVLDERNDPRLLVSGLVGRIWTLRRDYPLLDDPDAFRRWDRRGTARVVFANWIEPADGGRTRLVTEARVEGIGSQGRLGVAAVRPLVSTFHHLLGSDGLDAAVRRAERAAHSSDPAPSKCVGGTVSACDGSSGSRPAAR
jgi:hypothetical protein